MAWMRCGLEEPQISHSKFSLAHYTNKTKKVFMLVPRPDCAELLYCTEYTLYFYYQIQIRLSFIVRANSSRQPVYLEIVQVVDRMANDSKIMRQNTYIRIAIDEHKWEFVFRRKCALEIGDS
jgi:hypothetical protein